MHRFCAGDRKMCRLRRLVVVLLLVIGTILVGYFVFFRMSVPQLLIKERRNEINGKFFCHILDFKMALLLP